MKIITADNKPAADTFKPQEPAISLKPDSALLKDGKPFFIPDFTDNAVMNPCVVVRLCKLGKNIAERFAYRYFDAVTIGLDVRAEDVRERLEDRHMPAALSYSFDNSAILGSFVELEKTGREYMHQATFRLTVDHEEVLRHDMHEPDCGPERIISHISRFMTVKIGDLIFMNTGQQPLKAEIGRHIEGFIDDEKVLSFNIK